MENVGEDTKKILLGEELYKIEKAFSKASTLLLSEWNAGKDNLVLEG